MQEERFIQNNQATWAELEELNKYFAKVISAKETKKELFDKLERYAELNQGVSHHLAYGKTHFPNSQVVAYLNQIVSVSHNQLFVREKARPIHLLNYFTYSFPMAVKAHKKLIAFSGYLFIFAFLATAILSLYNPSFIGYFFSEADLGNISIEKIQGPEFMATMSAFIMANNIQVSIRTFTFGITIFGTIYILLVNGGVLGALWAHLSLSGNAGIIISFWALILPHGVIELFCIFMAAGAGLHIGKSLLMPQELSRKNAVIRGAKEAAALIPGIIILLVIAGVIEGFFTPQLLPNWMKLTFALATLFMLVYYFVFYTPRALTDK